jgi:hypothetical protein
MNVDIPVFDRKDLLHESDIPSLDELAEDYDDLNGFEHYED